MPDPLKVLQSFPPPRPTTNPYLVMLAECLRALPGITVMNFSWRAAMLERYDVYHVHWPEAMLVGTSPLKRLAKQLLTVSLLAKLQLTRTPIVRTVHNIELPRDISRRERLLLQAIERRTTLRIRVNHATETPLGRAAVTIPLGHYRDWFAADRRCQSVPGQVGYFGLIRRYKGIDTLIQAFRGLEDEAMTLRAGGKPSTDELASTIRELSRGDTRITLELKFLSDTALVDIVTSSELIVLPYRFMHNSGAMLVALSLDRPVLVPDNVVNQQLAGEVGPGWVIRYQGNLTGAHIVDALAEVRKDPHRPSPDLTARDWARAGVEHANAYREAITARRGRR